MNQFEAAAQGRGSTESSGAVDIWGRRCCEKSGEKVGEFFICVDDDVADDAVPGAGPIRRTAKASTINTRQTRSNRLSTLCLVICPILHLRTEPSVGVECRKSDEHGVQREATRPLQAETPSDASTNQRRCNARARLREIHTDTKQQQQFAKYECSHVCSIMQASTTINEASAPQSPIWFRPATRFGTRYGVSYGKSASSHPCFGAGMVSYF